MRSSKNQYDPTNTKIQKKPRNINNIATLGTTYLLIKMRLKYLLLTLLVLTSHLLASAQTHKTFYYKNNGRTTNFKDSCDYYRIISSSDSGATVFNLSDYYKNGSPKFIGQCLKGNALMLTGSCASYFPNGQLQAIKLHTDSSSDIGLHQDETSITACYDSLGRALLTNGNGRYVGYNLYEPQAADFTFVHEEGTVKNGRREGDWQIKPSSTDSATYTETYANGVLISGKGINNKGVSVTYTQREVSPMFAGGEVGFRNFIVKHVKYPVMAKLNRVQGRVYVTFVVGTDGKLTDMKAVRAPNELLGNAAIKAMSQSPNWVPGVQFGTPVRVQYTVPINFSLNN